MIVEAQVTIRGSKEAVWSAITDIDNAATLIRSIEKIEVVERPAGTLVGLKWRETRILFGEAATVEKWITDATDGVCTTRAEDSGFVFLTTHRIAEAEHGVTLISSHETQPRTLVAKLKALPMFLFKGAIKKVIVEDLNDIKSAVERASSATKPN